MKTLELDAEQHPKPLLKLPYKDGDDWKYLAAKNGCYLIQHRASFDCCWKDKHEAVVESTEDG